MKDKIEYIGARILIGFFQLLPFGLAVQMGVFLGALFYLLDRRHRRVALDNLRRCALGNEKSDKELRQIALGSFQNMGRMVAECTHLPRWTYQQVLDGIEIQGFEDYLAAREQGKGVILLTAHFGNWEWGAAALAVRGVPMHVVVRPIDNRYLDRMVQKWRERYGNSVINKKTAPAVEIVGLLKKGDTVAFLLDQHTLGGEAVFVDYIGRRAATHKGVAILALRTGAPVVPAFFIRNKRGYRIVIESPMALGRTGILKWDIIEATALFTRKIESYVRRHPDQWLWVHRRWKASPSSQPLEVEGRTHATDEPPDG